MVVFCLKINLSADSREAPIFKLTRYCCHDDDDDDDDDDDYDDEERRFAAGNDAFPASGTALKELGCHRTTFSHHHHIDRNHYNVQDRDTSINFDKSRLLAVAILPL